MKLVTDLFNGIIEINEDKVTTLVIENKKTFLQFIYQMYLGINGNDVDLILSEDGKEIKLSKTGELVTSIVPFDINEKRLLTAVLNALDKEAMDDLNHMTTMELLADIEKYIYRMSESLPLNIDTSLSFAALLKAAGIKFIDDSLSELEKIFNYMIATNEMLGKKLFAFVNLRTYFDTEEILPFIDTVTKHKLHLLLIDSLDHGIIKGVNNYIVDKDLCLI